MKLRKNRMLLIVVGMLASAALLTAGCAGEEAENLCKNVTCSGHGTCNPDTGTCNCEDGYEPSSDGKSCISDTGPCAGISCSGHGECKIDQFDVPYCECDTDYILDPVDTDNLTCIEKPSCLDVGWTCSDSTECCTNFCLKYIGDATGYCSRRDCQANDDCVDKSGLGKEMCCVDVGGEYFICYRLGDGCSCGDQTGTCGASCGCQVDSACAPDHVCLRSSDDDPNAQCSKTCTTNGDCDDCSNPDDPSQTFTCQEIFGGERYCRATDTETCGKSQDCEGDDVCIPIANDALDGFAPQCGKIGEIPTAGECDDQADPNELPDNEVCMAFYCFFGHCSEVCEYSADCPPDMKCAIMGFGFEGSDDTAYIGLCQWFGGSGTICTGDTPGATEPCPDGETCRQIAESPAETLYRACVTENCDPDGPNCDPAGTEGCADDGANRCYGDTCLVFTNGDSFCSATCETDVDCGDGMMCGLLGMGPTLAAGACVPSNACSNSADCDPGDVCMPFSTGSSIVGGCDHTDGEVAIGDACDEDADPDTLPPDQKCLGFYCFDDRCSAVCNSDADCPNSGYCGIINFCLDPPGCSIVSGIGMCFWNDGSGDPCGSNADCNPGEYCDFWVSWDGSVGKGCVTDNCDPGDPPNCNPPGGTGCDLVDAPPCYGGLCLTNGLCSTLCETSADCPDTPEGGGMVCQAIGLGAHPETGEDLSTPGCITFNGSGDPCGSNVDCEGNGEVCSYIPGPTGDLTAVCMTPVPDANDPGQVCPCKNDFCLTAGYCSAVCTTNPDCPANYECTWIGFGGGRFATGCTQVQPDYSPMCSTCAADADCQATVATAKCVDSVANPGEKYCTEPCPNGDECGEGFTCTDIGAGDMQCKPDDDTCIPQG